MSQYGKLEPGDFKTLEHVMKGIELIFSQIDLLDPNDSDFMDRMGDIMEKIEKLKADTTYLRDYASTFGNYSAVVMDVVDIWDNLYDIFEEMYNNVSRTTDISEIKRFLRKFKAYIQPSENDFYEIKSKYLKK